MVYCSKCGANLDENVNFCTNCGTTIGSIGARSVRRIQKEPRKQMSTFVIVTIILIVAISIPAVLYMSGYLYTLFPLEGSGNLITQEMNFDDFSIIEVGSGFEVEIYRSTIYNITITADDNLFDYIQVSKTNDKLIIDMLPGRVVKSGILRVNITLPDLYEVQLSGGSVGTGGGFDSSHDFVLHLSGGSVFSLEGSANDLTISASGGSVFNLSDFKVHNANVNLNGGSVATVNLDGRLDANLSGGSRLYYLGNPTLGDIVTSGGSTVSKKLSI